MKLRPIAIAFGAAILAIGIIPVAPALPVRAANGTIHGQLLDADTNQAPNLSLQTQACSGGPTCIAGTPSATDGTFTISVPAGTYNIRSISDDANCGPAAYALANKNSVSVGDGGNVSVQLLVTRHKGSVAGRITNGSGQGVTALVVVDNSEQGGFGQGAANTDGAGNYAVNCLEAGRGYFVSVFPAQPYVPTSNSQYAVSDNTSVTVNLTVRQGTSHINGNVSCLGLPNPGCAGQTAQVLVVQECPSACASWNGSTDPATGNFSSGPLAAGSYAIHIFSPNGWDNQAIFNINVAAGQTVTAPKIGIYMQGQGRSGRLVGNVSDAAGAPYANCTINAFNTGPATTDLAHGFITGVLTDANGNYDTGFTLAPGTRWKVYMDCPGRPELATDRYPNGSWIAIGPQYGVDVATVNFFWPEPGRPWTGGHDAIGVTVPATDAYFAEGFTGLNSSFAFHEYLTVENPGIAQILTVDYFFASGSKLTKTYNLDAQSRKTLNVNAEVGPDQNVSAHLSAPNPFVAERPMYFDYPGGITGGHDVMGAQTLGTTFYFAEGYTGPGFSEYLTLLNTSSTTTANVQVTYYFANGASPKTVNHPVGASTRQTVFVNDPAEAGAGQDVSMKVTSDQPILAERPMYFNYFGETGGHVVVGAQAPQTSLNLAEGHVGNGFDEYLTLLNPNGADANLTITYYRGGGEAPQTQTITVPMNQRHTVHVNDVLAGGTDSSIHIDSSQPIVAERPMYFTFPGTNWTGGHDAMAVPDSAVQTTFNFAEGYVAPSFKEYYTIMNRNAGTATVTFTYFRTGQSPVVKTVTIPPNQRFTEPVNADLDAGTSNSVQIVSDLPILAERPMYFAY